MRYIYYTFDKKPDFDKLCSQQLQPYAFNARYNAQKNIRLKQDSLLLSRIIYREANRKYKTAQSMTNRIIYQAQPFVTQGGAT